MAGLAAGGGGRSRLAPYLMVAPGALWLLLFFVAPVVTLGARSVAGDEARWWNPYARALASYGDHFSRSFGYASIATLIALALGYPLAYVMAFRAGRLKNLLLGLVVLPFFTAFLVRTFAWKTLLGDTGPIVSALHWLRLLPPDGRLLNTATAVVGGLVYNFLPFMVLPIYVSLEKVDRRLVEAAHDLYCDPARAFLRVVLPLSLPGVFAGSLLTFIPAVGDFVNAELLGGPNQQMIGSVIHNQFLQVRDYPLASALSFLLMAVITVGVGIYARVLGTEELA
jgi:spermidine/putrescine transport system permease protein